MSDLAIPLSPSLRTWVDTRVAEGEYVDAADYVRALVRRDREIEADIRKTREMIAEGFASGFIDAEPEDVLRDIMARLPDA